MIIFASKGFCIPPNGLATLESELRDTGGGPVILFGMSVSKSLRETGEKGQDQKGHDSDARPPLVVSPKLCNTECQNAGYNRYRWSAVTTQEAKFHKETNGDQKGGRNNESRRDCEGDRQLPTATDFERGRNEHRP